MALPCPDSGGKSYKQGGDCAGSSTAVESPDGAHKKKPGPGFWNPLSVRQRHRVKPARLNRIRLRMPLYLTFALMLFCFASISSARVVLSLYALHLGGQPFAVGALVATFYLFPLVLSWPIGILSDRAGSRGLLLFGTVCGAGGMAIPYFVRDLPALYVAGTMIGISFSFYNVLLQNLVGLLSKPHERVRNFSNSSLIGAFTNFAGPLLVGFSIDHWGHAVACLYVASLSLVAAVLVSVWGGVLPGGTRNAAPAASFREILADKGMLRILVISGLAQVGPGLYQF